MYIAGYKIIQNLNKFTTNHLLKFSNCAFILKKIILTRCFLVFLPLCANANIATTYQYGMLISNESTVKIQAITNDPIILNPDIDDINSSDPRIKSVVEYVKQNGLGISVVFSNPDNLRYVKKVTEFFQSKHITTDTPQFTQSQNKSDFNLIKIYVIKDNNNDSESKTAASKPKSNNKRENSI